MSKTKSADEHSREDTAERVVTQKRRYFFPDHGLSVEADDSQEAQDKVEKIIKKQKDQE